MIVLDTNVVSEIVKPRPDPLVAAWVRRHEQELATTAVTVAEIRYGLARLPDGRRKRELSERIDAAFTAFARQVIPFGTEAALAYGPLVAGREAAGRPTSTADGMIAAVCRSRDATLATRNTADFEHTGIALVNPWSSED